MISRKLLAVGIVLALAFFVAVLVGGEWLKRPFGEEEDIRAMLSDFDFVKAADAAEVDWDRAESLARSLSSAWDKVQRRIQFSVQTDDLLQFSDELTKLGAAVEIRDRTDAWRSVRLLQSIWERMR